MSAHALIAGTLHRDPEQRTSKAGKDFVTALLRSESQGETLWVNAVAFDEAAQAESLQLKAGESLSVQGAMKVSIFEKNGEHRASLDVVASHVLALRQASEAARKEGSRERS
jgi:single-stranded DNA-binding protein